MRLRPLVTGVTVGVVALTALGLRPAGPSASSRAFSAAALPEVRGGITYPCRVEYPGGFFPELCYLHFANTVPTIDVMTFDQQLKSDPAWSPDGTRLAFVRGVSGNGQIWSLNYWGTRCGEVCRTLGNSRRVAFGGEPAWSPTGTRLAFVSTRSGNADIYLVRDSGGAERRLTASPADDTEPAWSPNGKTIAFTRSSTIRLVDVNGSHDRLFGAGSNPAWSPNGKQLAFEDGGDILLANTTGARRQRLTSTPDIQETSPSWSADGRAVTFAGRSSDGTDAVYIRHLGGSLQRIVVSTDDERPFVQASVDWQHVRVLVATVSGRKPIVSFRDARGHLQRTLRAGLYGFAYVDRSRRHGIRFSWGGISDSTVPFVGRRWPSTQLRGGAARQTLKPGVYRYWCPAHPRERGTYRVIDQP